MSNESVNADISTKGLRKSVVAGSIGVFVHWFDWAVYAYLSTTLAQVFFPGQSGIAGLMAVFGVLGLSFVVRPIGALLFGHFGDRMGRKQTLSIVIVAMAGGTLMLGLLPSYTTIGLWAPAFLILARVIQGLAAGGEYGSAAAFMAEYTPARIRGFGVSWIEVGSLLGFLFASLVVYVLSTVLTTEALVSWGWRIPFLLAAPMGVIGFYIREQIEDTPDFKSLSESGNTSKSPLKEVITRNSKETVKAGGIEAMMNVTFYIVLVYMLTYQESVLGWSASKAALVSTLTSIIAMIVVPFSGILSDRIGRKPLLTGAAIALLVLSYPLFTVMHMDIAWAAVASTIGLGVILAVILGVHAVTCAELFPTRTRQSGMSIAYQGGTALFAGFAPFIITWLMSITGNAMVPAFYLMMIGAVGLAVMLCMQESRGCDLLDKDRDADRTHAQGAPRVKPCTSSSLKDTT